MELLIFPYLEVMLKPKQSTEVQSRTKNGEGTP